MKFILLLVICLGLFGCSQLKTAYEYADWAIEYRVDQYFDLSDAQETELKKIVSKSLTDLKNDKMKSIAKDFSEMANKIESDKVADGDFSQLFSNLQNNVYSALDPNLESTSRLVAGLSTEQMSTFEKKYAEYDTELQERIKKENDLPERKKAAFRAKRFRKRLLKWTGSLSKPAEEELLAFYGANRYPTEIQIKNRVHMLEKFKQAQKTSPKAVANYLKNVTSSNNALELKEYKEIKQEYFVKWSKAMSRVVSKMTGKERRRLASKFRGWGNDLDELSRGV